MTLESRKYSLDFVRALAIILILLAHLPDYGFLFLGQLSPYFGKLGVGLFLFISGYLTCLKNTSFQSTNEILKFYKKRAYRIYPLYLTALLVFFVLYGLLLPAFGHNSGMDFSSENMIIHILNLQILLSPEFARPLLTLFFIGLIGIYYLIYPFLIKFSHNPKGFLFTSMALFFIFVFLRYFFNIVDDVFFYYYFTFISGILFCFFSSDTYDKNFLKYSLAIPVILMFAIAMESTGGLSYPAMDFTFFNILNFVYLNIVIISFCLIQVEISNIYFDQFSQGTKEFVKNIAFSSFAVFLFHRPILTVFDGISVILGFPQIIKEIVFLFIAIPVIFIFSYYVQALYDQITDRFLPWKN